MTRQEFVDRLRGESASVLYVPTGGRQMTAAARRKRRIEDALLLGLAIACVAGIVAARFFA